MKEKSETEVIQPCPTPSDPMDCSLAGSSVHGIFQARVLEWGAIAFSRDSVDTLSDTLKEEHVFREDSSPSPFQPAAGLMSYLSLYLQRLAAWYKIDIQWVCYI